MIPVDNDAFVADFTGRCGIITYRDAGKTLEIYWEMSGAPEYDILLAPLDLTEWQFPNGEKIPYSKQKQILADLRRFVSQRGKRSDIDTPRDIEASNQNCAWYDCQKTAFKTSGYCLEHYDASLLRR